MTKKSGVWRGLGRGAARGCCKLCMGPADVEAAKMERELTKGRGEVQGGEGCCCWWWWV